MAKSMRYYIRKSHRYLGVILGIQFLIWTISGLYFSWSNIDEIHGDLQHKSPPRLTSSHNFVSPALVFSKRNVRADSIQSFQLVAILGKPYYSVQFFSGGQLKRMLADALTGEIRPAVSKEEAVKIAKESFIGEPSVAAVAYITSTNGHHEYREKPLPAWGVTFHHPSYTTVYVSAEDGKVESFRNNKWRVFDFLWMGHTMDYNSRDNINNWLLRIFSAFGLVTVLSGFLLYWFSSRWIRQGKKNVQTLAISTKQSKEGN
jgi:uncharacterized iron-regulated membrane protein